MKVFSSYDDYGYEDERIYSTLMTEEELYLFSEIQKEFNSVRQLKKGLQRTKKDLINLQRANPGMTTSQAKNVMSSNQNYRNVRNSLSKLESGHSAGTLSSSIQRGSRANMNISKKINEVDNVLSGFKHDPLPSFGKNIAKGIQRTPKVAIPNRI